MSSNNKKNMKILSLGISAMTIGTGIGIVTNSIVNTFRPQVSENQIYNSETTQRQSAIKQQVNDGYMNGNFLIKGPPNSGLGELWNETILERGGVYPQFNLQYLASVKGGIVGFNTSGTLFKYDENTGKTLWTRNDRSQSSNIIGVQYDRQNNAIIVIRTHEDRMWAIAYDNETGNFISETKVFGDMTLSQIYGGGFGFMEMTIIPVQNAANKFIVVNRQGQSVAHKYQNGNGAKLLTFDGTNFNLQNLNISYVHDAPFQILSIGAYYDRENDKITIAQVGQYMGEDRTYNKRIFLQLLSDGSRSGGADEYELFNNDAEFRNTLANNLRSIPAQLFISQYGHTSDRKYDVAWLLVNSQGLDIPNNHAGINFWTNVKKNEVGSAIYRPVSFGSNVVDFDLNNAFYTHDAKGDYYGYYNVTWAYTRSGGQMIQSNVESAKRGIMRIKFSSPSTIPMLYDENTYSQYAFGEANDRIAIFKEGFNKEWDSNKMVIVPSFNGDKIFNLYLSQRYMSVINPTATGNQDTKFGWYAYNTKGTGVEGTRLVKTGEKPHMIAPNTKPGIANEKAYDWWMNDATAQLQNYYYGHDDLQRQTWTQVTENFNVSIGEAMNPSSVQNIRNDLPENTKWEYFYHKGYLPIKITSNEGYVFFNGKPLERFEWINLFSGYHKYVTKYASEQAKIIDAATIGVNNYGASDFKNSSGASTTAANAIKQQLNTLLVDLPISFDIDNDLSINFTNPIPEARTVNAIITTNKWVDENNELQTTPKQWEFTINNLKEKYDITSYKENNTINVNLPQTQTATYTEDNVKDYIINNKQLFFNNIPENLSKNDLVITNFDNTTRSSQGIITFTLKLNKYYDNEGLFVEGERTANPALGSNEFTLTGFKTNRTSYTHTFVHPWWVDANIINHPIKNLYATQVKESDVRDLVAYKSSDGSIDYLSTLFSHLPSSFTKQNIVVSNIEPNPIAGTFAATIKINHYFNDLGELVDNGSVLEPGFKIIVRGLNNNNMTTSIANEINFEQRFNFKASEWKANENAIKEKIAQMCNDNATSPIVNLQANVSGQGFVQVNASHITLEAIPNVNANDANGEIQLLVKVSPQVAWVNGQPAEVSNRVTLKGFTIQEPTSPAANKNVVIPGVSSITTSGYTIEQVKQFIANNEHLFFNNIPEGGLDVSDIEITNFDPNTYSKNGQISLNVKIKKYYDSNGLLVVNGTDFESIKFVITGFKGSTPSNTSLKQGFALVTTTSSLFTQIFGNDKGFFIDWTTTGDNFTAKEEILKKHISSNIGNFLNNYQHTMPTGEILRTNVTGVEIVESRTGPSILVNVMFENWFLDGQPTNHLENSFFELVLKPTPTGESLVFNEIKKEFKENGGKLSVDEIKNIIANTLNNKLNQLPNIVIPAGGKFSPSDINLVESQLGYADNSVKIPSFSIGSGNSEISFGNMHITLHDTLVSSNEHHSNVWIWITVAFGGMIVVIILALLVSTFLKHRRLRRGKYSDYFYDDDYYDYFD